MFHWKKLGRIYNPYDVQNKPLWMHEFAQCTSAIVFDDFVRVYFSCRPPKDDKGQVTSNTTFLDLDRKNLTKIVRMADTPLLELGELGTFDEFGIYPTSVIKLGDTFYFYYAGWTRPSSVFADLSIGMAVSQDGENFERVGKGPILTKSLHEPFQLSGPKVRLLNGEIFMFYLAGEKWVLTKEGRTETFYKIRMARYDDAFGNWQKYGHDIIDGVLENECQAGPDVFEYNGKYHMYFSYRFGLDFRGNNRGYRIGYAHSDNRLDWTRDDSNAGIGLSDTGWDSQDMHYPHVFECDGKHYMLYNGNEFGRFGFGLAVLED